MGKKKKTDTTYSLVKPTYFPGRQAGPSLRSRKSRSSITSENNLNALIHDNRSLKSLVNGVLDQEGEKQNVLKEGSKVLPVQCNKSISPKQSVSKNNQLMSVRGKDVTTDDLRTHRRTRYKSQNQQIPNVLKRGRQRRKQTSSLFGPNNVEDKIHCPTKKVESIQNAHEKDCNQEISQPSIVREGESRHEYETPKEGKTQTYDLEQNELMATPGSNLKESVNENLNPQINVTNTILDKKDESYNKIQLPQLTADQTMHRATNPHIKVALRNIDSSSISQEKPKDVTHHNYQALNELCMVSKSEAEGRIRKWCRPRGRPRKEFQLENLFPASNITNNLQQRSTKLNGTFITNNDILLKEHYHDNNNINCIEDASNKQKESKQNVCSYKSGGANKIMETELSSVPEAMTTTGNSIAEDRDRTTIALIAALEQNVECGDCKGRIGGTQTLSPASLETGSTLPTTMVQDVPRSAKEELGLSINRRHSASAKRKPYWRRKTVITDPEYIPEYINWKRVEFMPKITRFRSKNKSMYTSESASTKSAKNATFETTHKRQKKKITMKKGEPMSDQTESLNFVSGIRIPESVHSASHQKQELKSNHENTDSHIKRDITENLVTNESEKNTNSAVNQVIKKKLGRPRKISNLEIPIQVENCNTVSQEAKGRMKINAGPKGKQIEQHQRNTTTAVNQLTKRKCGRPRLVIRKNIGTAPVNESHCTISQDVNGRLERDNESNVKQIEQYLLQGAMAEKSTINNCTINAKTRLNPFVNKRRIRKNILRKKLPSERLKSESGGTNGATKIGTDTEDMQMGHLLQKSVTKELTIDEEVQNEGSKNKLNKYNLKPLRIILTRLEDMMPPIYCPSLNKRRNNTYLTKAGKRRPSVKLDNDEPLIQSQTNEHTTKNSENNAEDRPKSKKNDTATNPANSNSDSINNKEITESDTTNENTNPCSIPEQLSLMSRSNETITPPQEVPDEIFDDEENTSTTAEYGSEKDQQTKWIPENLASGFYYNNTSTTDFNPTLMEEYLNESDEVFDSALMNRLQGNALISSNNEQYISNNDLEEKTEEEDSPLKCGDSDNGVPRTGPFKDKNLPNSSSPSDDTIFRTSSEESENLLISVSSITHRESSLIYEENVISSKEDLLFCEINDRNESGYREEEPLCSPVQNFCDFLPQEKNNQELHSDNKEVNDNNSTEPIKPVSPLSEKAVKRPAFSPNHMSPQKRLKLSMNMEVGLAKICSNSSETADSADSVDKDLPLFDNDITIKTPKWSSLSLNNSLRNAKERGSSEGREEELEDEEEEEEGDEESIDSEEEEGSANSDTEGKANREGQKPVRKWHCNICNEKYALIRNYLRHKYFSHKDETSVHICDNCTKVITSVAMVNIHVCTNVTSWTCKRCNLNFPNSLSLMQHRKRFHFETVGTHKCNTCLLTFLTQYMLERHKTKEHPTEFGNNISESLLGLKENGFSTLANSVHKIKQEKKLIVTVKQENHRLSTRKSIQKLNLANVFLPPDTSEMQQNQTKDLGITLTLLDDKQEFGCEICNVIQQSKSEMKVHLEEKHHISVRTCELCGDFYVLTRAFNHLIERHIVFNNGFQRIEEVSGQDQTKLTQYRNVPCELLKILGEKRFQGLEEYRNLYKESRNRYFFCATCAEEYLCIDSYVLHHLQAHDSTCILCNVEFQNSQQAVYHKIETHRSTTSYLWAVQKIIRAIVIAENYSKIMDSIAVRLNEVQLCEGDDSESAEHSTDWSKKLGYLYVKIGELKDECQLSSTVNINTEPSTSGNVASKDMPSPIASRTETVEKTALNDVNTTDALPLIENENAQSNNEEIPIIVLTEDDLETHKDNMSKLGSQIHSSCNKFPEDYYTKLLVAYMNHTSK